MDKLETVDNVSSELMGFDMKPKQSLILKEFIQGRHNFVSLPTGYGKSLCYLSAPVMKDKIENIQGSIALVVSPLRALMANQLQACSDMGISAAWFRPEASVEETEGIKEGKYSIVFTSPECAVGPSIRKIVLSQIYKKKLCLVAFDEAHCISEWGLEFRPNYRKVDILMSITNVPIMCLTGTLTEKIFLDVLDLLSIEKEDISLTAMVPNRPNIFLRVVSEPSMTMEPHMLFYWKHLLAKRQHADKAIIFTRDNQQTVAVFNHLSKFLGDKAFVGERNAKNRIIDLYTADSGMSSHTRVQEDFPKRDSVIRCLVCTTAFGMGIDIPDIKQIILWGAPSTTLSLWQQVGRAGRDGEEANAVLLGYKTSLVPSAADDTLREICGKSDTCIRSRIMSFFTFNQVAAFLTPDHCPTPEHVGNCRCGACQCCNVCRKKCPCYVDIEHLLLKGK